MRGLGKKRFVFLGFFFFFFILSGKIFANEISSSTGTLENSATSSAVFSPKKEVEEIVPFSPFPTQRKFEVDRQNEKISPLPTLLPLPREKKGGRFSFSVPNFLSFPEVKTANFPQWVVLSQGKSSQEVKILFEDSREGQKDFSLTVAAGDFQEKQGERIKSENLILEIVQVKAKEGTLEGIFYPEKINFAKSGQPYLLFAGKENYQGGIFEIFFTLHLKIPPGTPEGDYTTLLVFTIT